MADRPVTLAIVGAGNRGKVRTLFDHVSCNFNHSVPRQVYASYALQNPVACKVVAVAEPRTRTRSAFASAHSIPHSNVFADWKDLVAAGRLADAVVVAVQDRLHTEVVLACVPLGYHILCEKPLATSAEDCISIADVIKKAGDIVFAIGHGMCYRITVAELHCTCLCSVTILPLQ
jgi:predicted dehydrogenase